MLQAWNSFSGEWQNIFYINKLLTGAQLIATNDNLGLVLVGGEGSDDIYKLKCHETLGCHVDMHGWKEGVFRHHFVALKVPEHMLNCQDLDHQQQACSKSKCSMISS